MGVSIDAAALVEQADRLSVCRASRVLIGRGCRMFEAINGMLLDMLAAVARKDYEDRRRPQAQGQAKAMAEGRYKGRPEDAERNAGIASLLAEGRSWSFIQDMT